MNLNPLANQLVGKAERLLVYWEDPSITDILINGTQSLYVDGPGGLRLEINPFPDFESLSGFIERLLVPLGKRIDATQPYLDGRLADGSRFHLILPPIAVRGPYVSIRKFRELDNEGTAEFGDPQALHLVQSLVKKRQNLLIAGGTGSGKTTLLSWLLQEVGERERLAILEESMEIRTKHPHVCRLEARVPGPEGVGEVSLRVLLRNALRMRPDRIIVGECRGPEAFEMLQAMSTGHAGSLTTIHANSGLAAIKRLEQLVLMSGLNLSPRLVRDWIASCLDAVIFLKRAGQKREIVEVISVAGMEGEVYRILPRYQLKSEAIPPD